MIDKAILIKELSSPIGKARVLELSHILNEQPFALRDLIDVTFHPDKDLAFRAAWILENVFLEDVESYEGDLNYLISRVPEVEHAGCQRHYAKILMHITAGNAAPVIKEKLKRLDLEPVVEKCFDWLIAPNVKVAVKVSAADALFNIRERYPWIKEELSSQIRFLMRNGSAGMQHRGRKLLGML
jgi:hypothetical protein